MVRKRILLSLLFISYSGILYAHRLYIRNETNVPIIVQPYAKFMTHTSSGLSAFPVPGIVQASTYQLPKNMAHGQFITFYSDDPKKYWQPGSSNYQDPAGPGGCWDRVELFDSTNHKSLTVPLSLCQDVHRTVRYDNNGNLTFS